MLKLKKNNSGAKRLTAKKWHSKKWQNKKPEIPNLFFAKISINAFKFWGQMDGNKVGKLSGQPCYNEATKMNLSRSCKNGIFSLIIYLYFMLTRKVSSGGFANF